MKIFRYALLLILIFPVSLPAGNTSGCDDRCLEKKALLGDGRAALSLADGLLYGDREKMKNWYRVSAENGNALGAYNYAHFLVVDSKSSSDCYRAIYWFSFAAKKGHRLSKNRHDLLVANLIAEHEYENGCLKIYSR